MIKHHAAITNDNRADVLHAMIALGYSDRDAVLALKALPQEVGVSEGIKLALKPWGNNSTWRTLYGTICTQLE